MKFNCNWPGSFRGEVFLKYWRLTDDGRRRISSCKLSRSPWLRGIINKYNLHYGQCTGRRIKAATWHNTSFGEVKLKSKRAPSRAEKTSRRRKAGHTSKLRILKPTEDTYQLHHRGTVCPRRPGTDVSRQPSVILLRQSRLVLS